MLPSRLRPKPKVTPSTKARAASRRCRTSPKNSWAVRCSRSCVVRRTRTWSAPASCNRRQRSAVVVSGGTVRSGRSRSRGCGSNVTATAGPPSVAPGAQLGDQRGMAAMHAVEVADGDRAAPADGGGRIAPIDREARHEPHPYRRIHRGRRPSDAVRRFRYHSNCSRVGRTVVARLRPGRFGGRRRNGERKVRAPQDAVVGNAHRPKPAPRKRRRRRTGKVQQKVYRLRVGARDEGRGTRKDKPTAFSRPSPLAPASAQGKGEKAGGLRSLNVRAHQQPGDRLARQTPPGARPNKGAGLVRPVTTPG